MRVKEAAARLDISVSLCYALLASGKLKGTRHGLGRGTWRVSEQQLEDYLRSREWGGPTEKGADNGKGQGKFKHVRLP